MTGGLPGHESESGQAGRFAAQVVHNVGTLDDLLAKVTELMSRA